jgi:hypothetical protein
MQLQPLGIVKTTFEFVEFFLEIELRVEAVNDEPEDQRAFILLNGLFSKHQQYNLCNYD